MNFEKIYYEYLQFAKKQQKKQSFDTLVYKFNLRILPYFKNMMLEEITRDTIIKWEDYILSLNYTNNYNKGLYYLLSGFFTFCHKFYDFDKTIISDVGCFKKKYEVSKADFYTLKEFNKFIKYVNEPVYREFFNLMFFSGIRPGEAMALKISDLKGKYIIVNKTISSHGKREIGTPKTFSSIRKVKIDKYLVKDLNKLIKNYEKGDNRDLFLFGGSKPLSSTSINRRKVEACKKANLRPITLHQFRHSHATLLLTEGIVINEVSRRLGHSKVSTTLDVYTHTSLEQEKRVYTTLCFKRFFKNLLRIFIKTQ